MPSIHPAALEHELRRWMRPDAHRFVSPTWRRVVQPGSEAAAVFRLYEAKSRPDQPRVPEGVSEGGQLTEDGGGGLGGRLPTNAKPAQYRPLERTHTAQAGFGIL